MRDPERIDRVLALVRVYWKQHPDLRLGQILDNFTKPTDAVTGGFPQVFYLEDEVLEKRIRDAMRPKS